VLQGRWAATTTSLLAVSALVAGCAGTETTGAGAPAADDPATLVSQAVVAMKQTRTVDATFKVTLSGGVILQGTAAMDLSTGDKSVTYTGAGGPYTSPVKGQVTAANGGTDWYWRETAAESEGPWKRPDPSATTALDKPITAEFRAVSSTQLIDPLMLLDTGVTGAKGELTSDAEGRHLSYDWTPTSPAAKEPLASFLDRIKLLGPLTLDLTLDPAGHLAETTIHVQGGSTTYNATVTYSDYGQPLSIDPPTTSGPASETPATPHASASTSN
jgi:hypothetical protein